MNSLNNPYSVPWPAQSMIQRLPNNNGSFVLDIMQPHLMQHQTMYLPSSSMPNITQQNYTPPCNATVKPLSPNFIQPIKKRRLSMANSCDDSSNASDNTLVYQPVSPPLNQSPVILSKPKTVNGYTMPSSGFDDYSIKNEPNMVLPPTPPEDEIVEEPYLSTLEVRNLTSDVMKKYIAEPKVNTVLLMYPKVAQKSYGSEKRFLCPPPCTYLSLDSYEECRGKNKEKHGFIGCVSLNKSCDAKFRVSFNESSDFGLMKNLYVSDNDHVKAFVINLLISGRDCSIPVGTFPSEPIKVISKPSKKKQTQKNTDLCIASGSKVALFNRLRSQTVSTRYLHVSSSNDFHASPHEWGLFDIYLVDADQPEDEEFNINKGFVHYGSSIKLVCCNTGIALPKLIARKVERQAVKTDCTEAVSQLHKCAFQFEASERMYLCLNQDRIIQYTAGSDENINDNALWTIISAEAVEYKFYEAMGPVNYSVGPVPRVLEVKLNMNGCIPIGEIHGIDLTPALHVWFDHIQLETVYRNNEMLIFKVPPVEQFSNNPFATKDTFTVEIFLVRQDGVIYPSKNFYTYVPSDARHPTKFT